MLNHNLDAGALYLTGAEQFAANFSQAENFAVAAQVKLTIVAGYVAFVRAQ